MEDSTKACLNTIVEFSVLSKALEVLIIPYWGITRGYRTSIYVLRDHARDCFLIGVYQIR